jgi:recombination protein RecA
MKKLVDPSVKKMDPKEKLALLKREVAALNKKFDKEVVTFGSTKIMQRIPFKSVSLNEITGGGVPCGRFSVIWGGKGSAKTTTCYDLVSNAQKIGKTCLWIDFERSFDPTWATTQGVNVDELLIAPAFDNAEDAMDMIISLTKSKAIDLIIVDSIQGLSPMGEQENKKGVGKSMADDTMALLARKLSQFFRVASGKVAESDCTVVMIGQTRLDLGGFITLDKLSGGNALEHWSSMTIHVRRGAKKDAPTKKVHGEEVLDGFDIVARVDKSKMGPDEGKTTHVKFLFGVGIQDWDRPLNDTE